MHTPACGLSMILVVAILAENSRRTRHSSSTLKMRLRSEHHGEVFFSASSPDYSVRRGKALIHSGE
jgi:hypothetical protein